MDFFIETLGCSKNQVDSEVMAANLIEAGFFLTNDPSSADLIVINTCGFIDTAINESVDTILELLELKKNGSCKRVIVTGCLPQRFKEKIITELPEVDFFLGTGAFDKIVLVAKNNPIGNFCLFPDPNDRVLSNSTVRKFKLPHMAYLKISEGCNHNCSYCIIPKLRGKQKSRPIYQIITEAEKLIESGVREIILVAQDATNYGKDLCNKTRFNTLLESLAVLSKDVWIRFLYGNPDTIDRTTIEIVASYDNLCSYFDLPIQHVSENVLKNMGRLLKKKSLIKLFRKIRNYTEIAALRTTLITGFPGETNDNFLELLDFLDDIKFDHVGVFVYSDSEDLLAHTLPNHVDAETAVFRRNVLMSKQLDISRDNLRKFIGKSIDVLVESVSDCNLYEGRSIMQAPEVDGITYVHTFQDRKLEIGNVVPVKIVDSLEYDLIGEYNG